MKRTLFITVLLSALWPASAAQAQAWLNGYRMRFVLRVAQPPDQHPSKTVVAVLPTGSWVTEKDADSIVVQSADGKTMATAVIAHDPETDTLIQFARNGNDTTYYAYLLPQPGTTPPKPADPSIDPAKAKEGLFAQVRWWHGDSLDDWASVRQGMVEGKVQGHAFVSEIVHYINPARPGERQNFAISYRGHLKIDRAGTYRFLVDGDHANFLFIDGQLVDQKTGMGATRGGSRVDVSTIGTEIELTEGLHAVEYHQAVGTAPGLNGVGKLIWRPPGQRNLSIVPRSAFPAALYATAAGIEHVGDQPAAAFVYGVEDTLAGEGITIYLVRFQAVGTFKDPKSLRWNLGDGQEATGPSVTHVYVQDGDYTVTLSAGGKGAPAYSRRVHVWVPPVETSPLTLSRAVELMAELDMTRVNPAQLSQMFVFLLQCEQPARWPVLERVCKQLLSSKGLDLEFRGQLQAALITAMARQNRITEALDLADRAVSEFERVESVAAQVMLAAADVQRDLAGDARDAAARYQRILDRYRRLESPVVRQAAIHLGDLLASSGDFGGAREAYELASGLGGRAFEKSATAAAVTRGATLRMVEQKLRDGHTRFAQRMLAQVELEQPEQKLEGLYQVLRGEVDRASGRYEQAIRAYELVLAWPQWAGLRARAMHGIADCYARMGDAEEALRWLALLRDTDVEYFELHKLDEVEASIGERKTRDEKAPGALSLVLDLEPDHGPKFRPSQMTIVPGLSLAGPNLAAAWATPSAEPTLFVPVTNLDNESSYWIEYWYRNPLGNVTPTGDPQITCWLEPGPTPRGRPNYAIYPMQVWGQWVRHGALVKSPFDGDGMFITAFRRLHGAIELENVGVTRVPQRHLDAMHNFIQGDVAP